MCGAAVLSLSPYGDLLSIETKRVRAENKVIKRGEITIRTLKLGDFIFSSSSVRPAITVYRPANFVDD